MVSLPKRVKKYFQSWLELEVEAVPLNQNQNGETKIFDIHTGFLHDCFDSAKYVFDDETMTFLHNSPDDLL